MTRSATAARLFTVGHSTRSFDELVDLLRGNDVTAVADVRAHPGSRRMPQFGRDVLPETLRAADIEYRHFAALGGRRRAKEMHPQISGAWRNKSFAAYAEHTHSDEYLAGIHELEQWAKTHVVAVMCAEAVPWRCHRTLIANSLVARGHDVFDIIGDGPPRAHTLPEFARVAVAADGATVTYPAETELSEASQ